MKGATKAGAICLGISIVITLIMGILLLFAPSGVHYLFGFLEEVQVVSDMLFILGLWFIGAAILKTVNFFIYLKSPYAGSIMALIITFVMIPEPIGALGGILGFIGLRKDQG